MEPPQEPLSEHQALRLAIDALNQVPNYRLMSGEHRATYDLIPLLEKAYEEGKANEKLIEAAPDLFRELSERVRAEEREAAAVGETETPWLDSTRQAIAKAMPEPAPEQKTREIDIEPEVG